MKNMKINVILLFVSMFALCQCAYANNVKDVDGYCLSKKQFFSLMELIEKRNSDNPEYSWPEIASLMEKAGFKVNSSLEILRVEVTENELKQVYKAFESKVCNTFKKKFANFFYVKCTQDNTPICIMREPESEPLNNNRNDEIHVRDKYGRIWCVYKNSVK